MCVEQSDTRESHTVGVGSIHVGRFQTHPCLDLVHFGMCPKYLTLIVSLICIYCV